MENKHQLTQTDLYHIFVQMFPFVCALSHIQNLCLNTCIYVYTYQL